MLFRSVRVRQDGTVLRGPGIGDNCRGLAVLVAVIRSLNQASVRTAGTITFVANVGEEGLGNLRGVRELFGVADKRGGSARRPTSDIDRFVSIDGGGIYVATLAVGSRRYRVTFKGPGGHSFAAFGLPSAIHAMGRAVAKIGDLVPPANPKTTFTVGTVRGGTSVNAISGDATIGIDVRSNSQEELVKFVEKVMAAIHEAVADENNRWKSKAQITVDIKQVGDRPAGSTPRDARIVQAARAALTAVGAGTRSMEASSTDSNLPISLGVPAITLSSSGQAGGSHSLGEWYAPINNTLGAQNMLLLSLALAGVEGVTEPVLEKRAPRP